MYSSFAFVLAMAATGQQPIPSHPETIPAPPGYQAHREEFSNVPGHGPYGHGHMRRPSNFAYPTAHPYPDVAPQGIYGPKRCEGWMYPNGICGHRCVKDPHSWMNWWYPPGNMLPHYGYFPAEHGYYYFEPYNVTRVAIQQKFIASIGGDPRHPYANEIFDEVYKIYGQRHADEVGDFEEVPPDPTGAGGDDDLDTLP